MMQRTRIATLLALVTLFANFSFGATGTRRTAKKPARSVAAKSTVKKATAKKARAKTTRARRARSARTHVAGGPWLEPTFADSTAGDNVDGEDLIVRRAAVDAIGPYNGSVVVVDPTTGRILTMVNQKVALGQGFQPCSTVKIMAALAGLSEGLIERDTYVKVYGRTGMNLTTALAMSNNPYFAKIGTTLGYEKIAYYAKLFGYGEKAGLNIEEEQLGTLAPAPPANGGMGMMTSFGEGILQTPLQLAALLSAVANNGTLYYLQYPTTQAEVDHFVPRVKRHLPIQDALGHLTPGMMGAVEYGTARRAAYDPNEPIFGKTGTCTDRRTPTHLGWFGSYNEVGGRKLVVVVLLTGGRPINGPVASGIAGQVYRNLSSKNYFANTRPISPVALVNGTTW
jgi:cell division protein FtsI/penicillin-binding protein 2